ncbi:integrin alpha-8-like [Homarus americanus]|uniref:integrin alpha-8-like n=1 Tax=Homarus americanus TaxID=6706 RepID=UPI001C43EB5E|nr:integrin alpha-8-like [Homarus americanus]
MVTPPVMTLMVMMVAGLGVVSGFNIYTEHAQILSGPEKTHFGYNVALWSTKIGQKRLVIGAPLGKNSTAGNQTWPLGNIHVCEPLSDQCDPDPRLPNLLSDDTSTRAIDFGSIIRKQGIGFGETLYTANQPSSKLVACAPRYVKIMEHVYLQARGICYVLDDVFASPEIIYPFPNDCFKVRGRCNLNTGVYTGRSMTGFSASILQGEEAVISGAPFAFSGSGLLIKTIENRPTVRNFHTDPTYLIGWATVTGRFNGVTEMIATSSSLDVYGIITFYYQSMFQVPRKLQGKDVGVQFGYSLGVGDIDGDGTDDLLVGAPLAKGIEGAPDCGRVYIYYSPVNQYPPWASPLVLAGREPWGRFGQAVTSPGDLNQDGYDEVVVGSPFDGGGVVYVFNGAAQGLIAIPAQEIRASEFSPGIRGFGFSLDGGVDMDDNGYPDLIIGSPESDNAVFLRSSPVVSLEGFVMFDPSIVVLGKRSCTVITDDVVCFNLEFDLKYSSKTKFEYLQIHLVIKLDPVHDRLAFIANQQTTLNVTREIESVDQPPVKWTIPVYVKTGRPRLDAPIEVDATASLKSHLVRLGTQSSKLEVPTILDQLNPVDLRAEARLTCADPTTCFSKPDLLLQTTAPTQLVIGDGALAVEVQLVVREDAAFAVKLFLVTPTHLVFVRVSGEDTIPACVKEPPQTLTSHELSALTCRFTSDLYKNKKVFMTFHFEYNPETLLNQWVTNDLDEINLQLSVTSDSVDLNEEDNNVNLIIPVFTHVHLQLSVMSDPDIVEGKLNETASQEMLNRNELLSPRQLGPAFTQRFSVLNHGPSPVFGLQMLVEVPVELTDGQPVWYLVEEPRTSGPVYCSSPPLNPRDYNFTEQDTNDILNGDTIDDQILDPTNTTPQATQEPPRRLRRREADDEGVLMNPIDDDNVTLRTDDDNDMKTKSEIVPLTIDCQQVPCQLITCNVSSLKAGSSVSLSVSGYAVIATLKKMRNRSLGLESRMKAEVTYLYSQLTGNLVNVTDSTHVIIITPPEVAPVTILWWHWLLIVLVSCIIIVTLMVIMKRLGFFKRKRAPKKDSEMLMKNDQRQTMMNDGKKEEQRNGEEED